VGELAPEAERSHSGNWPIWVVVEVVEAEAAEPGRALAVVLADSTQY
jgi:hypothetical protein